MYMANIAIAGATGAVGQEILNSLAKKEFPVNELKLFSSSRSAGNTQATSFGPYILEEFSIEACKNIDIIFFAVGGDFSRKYASELLEKNDKIIIIDNSSAFRYDKNIPLVVPAINASAIKNSRLIANPNCTTAILAMVLHPIYKEFGLKKCIVSTYQATSGAGNPGMQELLHESKNYIDGLPVENKIFSHPIPFNLIPHIDVEQENHYTKEEMKVTWETHKIFEDDSFPLSCTAVRVPIIRAHSESVVIETKKNITENGGLEKVREILINAVGVTLRDDIQNNNYPMPLNASEIDEVQVGRIRKNLVFGDFGLEFFVCGDQLLRGAALNAVEIAELVKI
ncbi:TPA: aspartate-semialdehyde dehydrogenase [Candidatus Peregrinibacteria bacterium]|nr:aspartate-semialdehyde dehydrogenase [Candidatus Peregrinibacteria bacterium]HIQ57521.1 aspartate-semialdehyde dehydrogenase [Candidatus Gracilibacteria bacterium]